jgi:hypothetical protein
VGSYFALQWLANILVAATTLASNCVQSETAHSVLLFVNLLAQYGLSVIGTNVLCHRYLVEKARVMIKLYILVGSMDDANDPSVKYLEVLEGSLVWEARSLCFVAVGAPAILIYQPVGLAIAGLGVLVVVVMVLPLVCSHPSLVIVWATRSNTCAVKF